MKRALAMIAIDLETTGLDPHTGVILECAAIFVDAGLEELARYHALVGYAAPHTLPMSGVVRAMHTRNGLLDEIADGRGTPLGSIERELIKIFDQYEILERPRILGSTPSFDLAWIKRHMPSFARNLSYRTFDVTTLRHAEELAFLREPGSENTGEHRAETDIMWSLNEARRIVSMMKALRCV